MTKIKRSEFIDASNLCRSDLHRRLECRWSEAVRNSARQVGMVFVDDAD
jgi:hypothetical protein